MIFNQHEGSWKVKYNETNIAAKKLWNKICAKYSPRKININKTETILVFSVK